MEWKPKWVALPILDFTREIFARKDDPQKGWEWVMDFANALFVGNTNSKNEFANELIKDSKRTSKKNSESGKKGMASRWGNHTYNRKIAPPKSFEEVVSFAESHGLDYDDTRLWWERNFVERPGCDKDGVVFENWKGALINAVKAAEEKRRQK